MKDGNLRKVRKSRVLYCFYFEKTAPGITILFILYAVQRRPGFFGKDQKMLIELQIILLSGILGYLALNKHFDAFNKHVNYLYLRKKIIPDSIFSCCSFVKT